jgi:hypothetical protein
MNQIKVLIPKALNIILGSSTLTISTSSIPKISFEFKITQLSHEQYVQVETSTSNIFDILMSFDIAILPRPFVTPGFRSKTECIAYVCQDPFPYIC